MVTKMPRDVCSPGFRHLVLVAFLPLSVAFLSPVSVRSPIRATSVSSISSAPVPAFRCRQSYKTGSVLGLRAQADEVDAEKSKQLAEAWIRNDKAGELRKLLGGSSIYLVGLPGCGSEKIGNLLAKRLESYRFLDMCEVMAAAAGQAQCNSYAALMAQIGEKDFRELEEAVLDQVQAVLRCVVSLESGAVVSASNWGRMQQGLVVHVDSEMEALVAKSGMSEADIEGLKEKYSGYMDLADVKISASTSDAVDTSAIKIIDALTHLIKTNPPKRSVWQAEHDKRIAEENAAMKAESQATKQNDKDEAGGASGKGFAPKKK